MYRTLRHEHTDIFNLFMIVKLNGNEINYY